MSISNVQSWLVRAFALLIAWTLVLLLAAIMGTMVSLPIWPFVLLWLWVGLLLMLFKPGSHPMPDDKFIDVIGALAMLWRAAKWPSYVFEK